MTLSGTYVGVLRSSGKGQSLSSLTIWTLLPWRLAPKRPAGRRACSPAGRETAMFEEGSLCVFKV